MRAVTLAATLISLLCFCGLCGCEKSAEDEMNDAAKDLNKAAEDMGDAIDEATE